MRGVAALVAIAAAAYADTTEIPCPPADHPVADLASLLSPAAEERVARACASMKAPVAVVTIPSMAKHGGAGGTIESLALRGLGAGGDDLAGAGRAWG